VLGLFHLYPTIYFHKATRGAEKVFGSLLTCVFQLAIAGDIEATGLPAKHPIILFAKDPNGLSRFCALDDSVVWGALPMLMESPHACVAELSKRLFNRDFYKAIDVTAKLEAAFTHLSAEEREERRRKAEATIRVKLSESGLLALTDSAPCVLDDVVKRDPYRQGQGDGAVLDSIYAVDRTGEVMDLSRLSRVVEALKKYEVYRIYYRESDTETKTKLDGIIEEHCHA
jgi:uncharacterized protein